MLLAQGRIRRGRKSTPSSWSMQFTMGGSSTAAVSRTRFPAAVPLVPHLRGVVSASLLLLPPCGARRQQWRPSSSSCPQQQPKVPSERLRASLVWFLSVPRRLRLLPFRCQDQVPPGSLCRRLRLRRRRCLRVQRLPTALLRRRQAAMVQVWECRGWFLSVPRPQLPCPCHGQVLYQCFILVLRRAMQRRHTVHFDLWCQRRALTTRRRHAVRSHRKCLLRSSRLQRQSLLRFHRQGRPFR